MSEHAPERWVTLDLAGTVIATTAELVSVKSVDAGARISYGGEWVASKPTRLGLVASGYGDGIPRSASGASVSVRGAAVPIVGRVAMDQVVVDLGEAAAEPGDEVTIFGAGGLRAKQWAQAARLPLSAVESFIGSRAELRVEASVPDADEMEALGERIGGLLRAGDAVILLGELGAGKTTLTRGIGAALGAVGTVQSPTFVIARTHETASVPLVHVDAYRLGEEALLEDLDLDLDGSITVAEWGGPLAAALEGYLLVEIERALGGDADPLAEDAADPRVVRLSARGSFDSARLQQLWEGA